jgi:hypothetical protein
MISCLEFVQSKTDSPRGNNAVVKALMKNPAVIPCGEAIKGERIYRVERSSPIGRYYVLRYTDPDGQEFVECWCKAGTPPLDAISGLPAYTPLPCYHAAAVILYEANLKLPKPKKKRKQRVK